MPVRLPHHFSNRSDVVRRHLLVKEIAHGVDEDLPRSPPTYRLIELFRHESQIESLLEGMAGDAPKPLGERLRIAELTAGAHLGTPSSGIPGRVGPFDC